MKLHRNVAQGRKPVGKLGKLKLELQSVQRLFLPIGGNHITVLKQVIGGGRKAEVARKKLVLGVPQRVGQANAVDLCAGQRQVGTCFSACSLTVLTLGKHLVTANLLSLAVGTAEFQVGVPSPGHLFRHREQKRRCIFLVISTRLDQKSSSAGSTQGLCASNDRHS